jgi:hypothetical protein
MAAGTWRIEGQVHVLAGSRLTDSLNSKAKDFIAVTDAVIYDATTGRKLFDPDYVAVNRDSIIAVFPVE